MKKYLTTWAACGALLVSGAALAQSHGHGHGHESDSSASQHGDWGGHGDHGDHGNHDDRDDRDDDSHGDRDRDHRGYVEEHGRGRFEGMHDRGRHEGWYKRGGRVPEIYRSDRYYVTDWHRAHLREPPRGYRWVRSDNGDFLMVAVATGIIVDILINQ